jgi:hypothetical protein
MIRKNLLKVVLLVSLSATLSFAVVAQPGNPDPPEDLVPISGIEILLVAGGIFGGAKMFKKFKKD